MTPSAIPNNQAPTDDRQPADPTLYATVINLIATQEGRIPATQGRLAQAAFLDIMRAVDPALSEALHVKDKRRPYTISPLQGLRRVKGTQIPIRRGQQVWLRITLLDSHLFATLVRYFLSPALTPGPSPIRDGRGGMPTLRLGALDFAIGEILTTPGSHPWAGYTTFQELGQRWRNGPLDRAARRIKIEFASPTVFSRSSDKDGMGKFMEPLPTPAMFFGSLAARWNDLLPLALDKEAIRAYAEETVVVGQYDLASRMSQYWGRPQIGVTGAITYHLKDKRDEAMIRALNLLADFTFYGGVGARTAMGMGMGRRIKN